jgi:hypothetical protein
MKGKLIILLDILMIFLMMSCSPDNSNTGNGKSNYVILLDLSDRMLQPHQKEQDIEVIKYVYKKFINKVRDELFVNSADKFCVRVLPQRNSGVDVDYFNELLAIDMSRIDALEKKNELLRFDSIFTPVLDSLYNLATLGESKSDYFGVDIWKYFNEKLGSDLFKNYENNIYILTDGYFDFELYNNTKRKGNYYTSSEFLSALKGDDWKEVAEEKKYGLLPLEKKFDPVSSIAVIGINPKTESLNEYDKLIYFWRKWLVESGFNVDTIVMINQDNSLRLLQKLTDI